MQTRMQQAYDAIRARIEDGTLAPGVRLVNRTLSRELGISTVTVREALHRLASEGLVDHVPNAGAFVRDLGAEEVLQLYDFRGALEVFAVERAVERRTQRHLELFDEVLEAWRLTARRIREVPDRVARDALHSEWLAHDLEFHRIIYQAAGNGWLDKAVCDLQLLGRIASSKRGEISLSAAAKTLRGHVALAGAIRRRDAEGALRWARRHAREALRNAMSNA